MESINCPICNSTNFSFYLNLKDRFNISNEEFSLVKCECLFIYLNPRPNELEINKYYNSKAYSPHNKVSVFYKAAQYFSFKWKFNLIKKYTNKKNKILDYGSGKGEFADYLNRRNFQVNTYDPILDNKNSTNIINEEQKYNIITLWHSLEHIHNLNRALKKIKKSLNKKGYIFLAIPNIDAIEKIFFNKGWVAYDAPRHLYHFNEDTLSKLLAKYDFKILQSKTIFQDTFYNIYLSIQSKNLIIKLVKFVYISLISFFTILFNNNKSSSKLYICTKK